MVHALQRIGAVVALGFLMVASPQVNAEDVRVFALTSNRLFQDQIDPVNHPRLADAGLRELVRQGLLITARDEFGLATRDESLLETVDRTSPETFDVVVTPKMYHGINFEVSRNGEKLLELYIRNMFDDPLAYQNIAEVVERQSRNKYPGMLKKAGYERHSHEWKASAELPEGVDSLLSEMNDISQFRAVRAIHQAIRESGESPERLAGLVRGYSNLGQLTVRNIDCRGYVFRCRSWLYAMRLRHKDKASPLSEWCLAYCKIMLGQPAAAKQALDEMAVPKDQWPGWAKLMDDYRHYRFEELAEQAFGKEDANSELATVLWVRAIQQLNSPVASLEAGKQAIDRLPHCLSIQEQMYPAAGVGYERMLNGMGPRLLSGELLEQLPRVEGLPRQALEKLDNVDQLDQASIAELAKAIVAAGADDRQEPSLEVLGRNIEAFNMLHVFRIAWVWKSPLGSEAAEYIDQLWPGVKQYRLYPLLDTFRYTKNELPDTLEPLVANFEFKEGNPFFGYDLYATLPGNLKLQNTTVADARDVCWYAHMQDEEFFANEAFRTRPLQASMLDELEKVSDESPLYISTAIEVRFNKVKGNLDEWTEKYGHYPSFHRALGMAYLKQRKYEKAAKHLEIASGKIADSNVLQALADAYYRLDDDRWLAALQMILDREDYGLEHSRANAIIAGTLMNQGKFDEALPFAEASAQSGASWAFRTYMENLTALDQFAEAEDIARADTYRYRTPTWFMWCAATGQGDLEAAWETEQKRMAQFDQLSSTNVEVMRIWYHMAAGDDRAALAQVTKLADEGYRPFFGILQAQLADSLGEQEVRDAALEKLAAWKPDKPEDWSIYSGMAALVHTALKENRTIAESELDPLLEGRQDKQRWWPGMYYVMAEHNRLHGTGEEQVAIFKRLASEPQLDSWPRVLAWIRLRKMDIEPAKLVGRHFLSELNKVSPTPRN